MSLLAEVDALVDDNRFCPVSRWLIDQSKTEAAEIDEAVASEHPFTLIYQALVKRHIRLPYSMDTFARHYGERRGKARRCSCR